MFTVASDWLTSIQRDVIITYTFTLGCTTWKRYWALRWDFLEVCFVLLVPGTYGRSWFWWIQLFLCWCPRKCI